MFALAGFAKLADRDGARQAVRAFALPLPLVTPIAAALPIIEIGVGVALLITATAIAGAIGAMLLLGLFIAGITVTMGRGRQADCRCFGQLHSAPVGWKTLVRNLALVTLAALVIVNGAGSSIGTWRSGLTAIDWVELVVAMALAIGFVYEGSLLVERWRRSRHRGSPRLPQS